MTPFSVPVEEFTTPSPITGHEEMHLDEMQALMKQHGIRHLPIVKNENVIGIVSERDLKVAFGMNPKEKRMILASDIMAREPVTVSAGATLDEVAFEMSEKKIGSVIVNDEKDQLLGIFTVTDALNALIEIARESAPHGEELEDHWDE